MQGKTAVCVSVFDSIVGVIGIADMAKPEAYGAIRSLKAMDIDVWMLTGQVTVLVNLGNLMKIL